jgi:hypothetical protein
MFEKILIGLTVMGGFMNTLSASDFLAPSARVKVTFTVSDSVTTNQVRAHVTLSADGLQRLPPDGLLSVNSVVMNAKRLQKQGFWYQDQLPRATQYDLVIRRAKAAPEVRFVLHSRRFVPEMPKTISRSADLQIRFEGSPPQHGERMFIKLASAESAPWTQSWRLILKGVVEGNRIRIPAGALATAEVGEAVLNLSLHCSQPITGTDHDLTYAVGAETRVYITD